MMCGLLLVTWLATWPGIAVATSCKGTSLLLEGRYAAADAIVVAQANGCMNSKLPTEDHCSEDLYQLDVTEVLKDSIPSRDHSGTFQGDDHMGCGLVFRVSQSYLLFFDDEGLPMHDLSGYLSAEDWRFPSAKESLEILRQFRDRKINDLSGPWRFTDTGLSCDIEHRLDGASIGLKYDYSDYYGVPMMGLEGNGPSGEARYQVMNSTSQIADIMGEVEIDYGGPENGSHSLVINVSFYERKSAAEQLVTISIGDQSWPLDPMTVRWTGSRSLDPSESVSDLLGGPSAAELLEAMMVPTDIVVSVVDTPSNTNYTAQGSASIPPLRLKTRSTQLAASRKQFDACIRGDIRRGAIVNH